jgi:hypothetical protein
MQVAEETSRKIEAASQQYRPCSVRASVLYFVLNDLAGVDPMYQFSLDAYMDLFALSIKNSPKAEVLADRIKSLNDYHTCVMGWKIGRVPAASSRQITQWHDFTIRTGDWFGGKMSGCALSLVWQKAVTRRA